MDTPVASLSTVKDLRLFYENLLDDAPDADFTYQLLTQAKNRIELENDLFVLRDEDTSQTANSNDTYANTHALPLRWRKTRYMKILPAAGVIPFPYFPTSFEKRMQRLFRRYFIDLRNKAFGFTGVIGSGGTIYHGFMRLTDAFTANNEDSPLTDVLEWPEEYAPIIAYEAAGFYQAGVDPDSISSVKSQANLGRAQSLMDSFIAWDQDLKLEEMGGRTGFADDSEDYQVPIGLM